jgi:hypothetical protein
LWTPGNGVVTLDPMTTNPGDCHSVALDSAHVAFFAGTGNAVKVTGLDGKNGLTLIGGSSGPSNQCTPRVDIVGGRVIALSCNATSGSVTSFDPTSGASVVLTAAANSFQRLSSSSVLTVDNGVATAIPVGGGAGVTVAQSFSSGLVLADGAALLWQATDEGLWRSPTDGSAATALQHSGRLMSVSPDEKWLTYVAPAYDVQLAATTTAGASAPLVNRWESTPSTVFTDDSAFVAFTDGASVGARAVGAGSVFPLASSGSHVRAAGGARVVFESNYDPQNGSDLMLMDLGSGAPATRLASGVGGAWTVSRDDKTLVWVTNDRKSLYAMALPE